MSADGLPEPMFQQECPLVGDAFLSMIPVLSRYNSIDGARSMISKIQRGGYFIMKYRLYRFLTVAVLILALITSIAGCGSQQPSVSQTGGNQPAASDNAQASSTAAAEKPDPFGKYNEVVTLTTGLKTMDKFSKLPQGDNAENNEYTRYVKEKFNIQIKGSWEALTGEAYDQKVKLTLASADISDYIQVFGSYPVFKAYVDSGLIMDIKSVYEDYASPAIKSVYDSTKGEALKMVTFDGKQYAMPGINKGADCINLLWVRQDWLDKLSLKTPSTLDDIIETAKAFIERDPDGNGKKDTFGLTGMPALYSYANSFFLFDTVFSFYKSYPLHWFKDGSGKVYYGSIANETKTALVKLQGMYKAGVIDKEFALRKDQNDLVNGGKCGMFFGPWWMAYNFADSVKNDPKANWKAVLAPLSDDGKLYSHMQGVSKDFIVISNKCKNPEAVLKILNLQQMLDSNTDPKAGTFYDGNPDFLVSRDLIGTSILLTPWDDLESQYRVYKDLVDGKVDINSDSLSPKQKKTGQILLNEIKAPLQDLTNWTVWNAYMVGGAAVADPKVQQVFGVYYGQTKTMESKWASLLKLENESFLKIIMGDDISNFDAFVQQWKELGGDAITGEVQQEVDRQ